MGKGRANLIAAQTNTDQNQIERNGKRQGEIEQC